MTTLAKRLARGDSAAFAELYDVCADRLYHYLTMRLGSHDDAADVLQETFLRLARSPKKLAQVSDPVAYAFVAARNESTRWLARKDRENRARAALAESLFFEAESHELAAREAAEMVTVGLSRLKDDLREIVELKMYAGLTFAAIATVTGLPQGTVATRYRTALAELRRWLAKERT